MLMSEIDEIVDTSDRLVSDITALAKVRHQDIVG